MLLRGAYLWIFVSRLAAQDDPQALLRSAHSDLDAGRYEQAIGQARRSAEGFRNAGNPRDRARAQTAAGLAEMYSGDYAASIRDLEDALQVARDIHDFGNEIGRLNNIGSALYFQGLYGEAMERYQEAMRRVAATPDDRWTGWGRQITLANIAVLYQTLGQFEKALDLYTGLLRGEQSLPPREQAQFLTNAGVLRRRLGDPRKALYTYRAAQALYRRAAHRNGEIAVLNDIGIVQAMDFQDWKGAETTFTNAYELAEQSGDRPLAVQARLYRGETFYRAGRRGDSKADFEDAAARARELGGQEEEWKALYGLARIAAAEGNAAKAKDLLGRAVALIETLRLNTGAPSMRSGFLADKRAVYDLLIENAATAEDAFRWMEQSRARVLRDRRGVGRAGTLQSFASSLRPNTAVLEFWAGDAAAAVIWISASQSGIKRWRIDGGAKHAMETVGTLLSDPSRGDWRDAVRPIARQLLDGVPVLDDPRIKRLIVVPDGSVARVPFEALPLEDSLLIQRYAISYSPAAALIATGHSRPRLRWPWQTAFTGFADPSPGPRASDGIVETREWPRLPEAVREINGIAGLSGGRSILHVGTDARKEWIVSARRPPVLHFATHGFADLQNPDLSYLLLAPASRSRRFDYLFLKEVYGLPLGGVELVTLSACETEAGKLAPGEGVESFSQAFLATGVRAVVTSLWRVGDKPAAELMLRFYRRVWAGEPVEDALRGAKIEFLRHPASSHPAYWAAFAVYGDGNLKLPYVIRWAWMAIAGALVLGAGIYLWRLPKRQAPGPRGAAPLS